MLLRVSANLSFYYCYPVLTVHDIRLFGCVLNGYNIEERNSTENELKQENSADMWKI